MPLTDKDRTWYYDRIEELDPRQRVVKVDRENNLLTYASSIRMDESHIRSADAEEVVRALALCMLVSKDYKYSTEDFYIERYYKHGNLASMRDEIDIIIYDNDDLPFAMWELKSADDYTKRMYKIIESQLFGTAPLIGAPKLLVYATIRPTGKVPKFTLICIDRTKYQSFESWDKNQRPASLTFPPSFTDPAYEPLVHDGKVDLRIDSTQADFRAVAATFHAEFFGEHPDNVLFTNLVKCLLAKIYDERQTKKGEPYQFQILYNKKGQEESAASVFKRVNDRYRTAYSRYIERNAPEPDEINPKEFSPERVKTVVKELQGMAITRGAALHGDVIGAFFEEILRAGFKQDKGMYFTHDNLVYFIIEALDLDGLTVETWKKATHPENRLPYVIDPACGAGTFLLRSMYVISNAVRSRQNELVSDMESISYFNSRMSDDMPNNWAESFIYGLDPKFVMAITAKVNMVLHGDGSAHIFKHDSLSPLSTFADDKLKPLSDPHRSIPKARYRFEVSESFDVVVSNPPFGITIAANTKALLSSNFSLRDTTQSECYFLERWFQLLKPNGRLGVVLPESLLNAADSADVRLFLYRMFWIRAIVALPRNLFIETPTLTSLLFAQKKTSTEIEAWDIAWAEASSQMDEKIKQIKEFIRGARRNENVTPQHVEQRVIADLSTIIGDAAQIIKKGDAPVPIALPADIETTADACNYYRAMMQLAGVKLLVRNRVFGFLCEKFDYNYPVYLVDEVGYKLSKRKERLRPNQLARFVGINSKIEMPNLHLADEPFEVLVDMNSPERILDFIRRDVKWT